MTGYLGRMRLPSSAKALLPISSKTWPHIGRAGEDEATLMRAEASAGNVHPASVVMAWKNYLADSEAVRGAAEAVVDDISDAINILEGADLQPQGAFAKTAAEMAFIVSGLSDAASDLARSKATGLREDAVTRLRAIKATAQEDIDGSAHRTDAVRRKLSDALISALAKHEGGELRFSLNDARSLLGWEFIPHDDRPLPEPCSSPYRRADDPRCLAGVLVNLCTSKEAAALAAAEAAMEKRVRKVRAKKSQSELIKDQLATLPRN